MFFIPSNLISIYGTTHLTFATETLASLMCNITYKHYLHHCLSLARKRKTLGTCQYLHSQYN